MKINKRLLLKIGPSVICIICMVVTLASVGSNTVVLNGKDSQQVFTYKLTESDSNAIASKIENDINDKLVEHADLVGENKASIVKTVTEEVRASVEGITVPSAGVSDADITNISNKVINSVNSQYVTNDELNNLIQNEVKDNIEASLAGISERVGKVENDLASVSTGVSDNTSTISAVSSDVTKMSSTLDTNTIKLNQLSTEFTSFKSETLSTLESIQLKLNAINTLAIKDQEDIKSLDSYAKSLELLVKSNDEMLSQNTKSAILTVCESITTTTNTLSNSMTYNMDTVNDSLRTQVTSLSAVISQLGLNTDDTISALSADLALKISTLDLTQQDSYSNLATSINNLESNLDNKIDSSTKESNDNLIATKEELLSYIAQVESGSSTEDIALTQKLNDLEDSVNQLSLNTDANFATVNSDIQALKTEDIAIYNQMSSYVADLTNDIATLKLYAETNVDRLDTSISDLKTYTDNEVATLNTKIVDLKNQLENADAVLKADMEANVSTLTNMINTVSTDMTNMEADFNTKLLEKVYPVGSVYMSTTNVNPSTIFGGTWQAWGTGKVPVAVDTSNTLYNTVEKTGGSNTTILSIANLPSHNHTYSSNTTPTGSVASATSIAANGNHAHTFSWYGAPSAGASTSVWVDANNGLTGWANNFAVDTNGALTAGGIFGNNGASNSYAVNTKTGVSVDSLSINANHAHTAGASTSVWVNGFTVSGTTSADGSHAHTATTSSTFTGNTATISGTTSSIGSGTAVNNVQPYITCYMWKRVS